MLVVLIILDTYYLNTFTLKVPEGGVSAVVVLRLVQRTETVSAPLTQAK